MINDSKLVFRLLRKEEIDCRIATVTAKGVTLLLYKDARVDQNILDETIGPMNWQRHHSRENANCIVSIWDDDKKQWIQKEDTGKESFTDAEKGLASDSFKRACFNWGIGRELYTAPFIWIPADACKIETVKDQRTGHEKFTCRDKFTVSEIGYDDSRSISKLIIKCKNRVVYTFGEKKGNEAEVKHDPMLISEAMKKTFVAECTRIGKSKKAVLAYLNVENLDKMAIDEFRAAMEMFKKTPDKEVSQPNPQTIPPDDLDCGLPFNSATR